MKEEEESCTHSEGNLEEIVQVSDLLKSLEKVKVVGPKDEKSNLILTKDIGFEKTTTPHPTPLLVLTTKTETTQKNDLVTQQNQLPKLPTQKSLNQINCCPPVNPSPLPTHPQQKATKPKNLDTYPRENPPSTNTKDNPSSLPCSEMPYTPTAILIDMVNKTFQKSAHNSRVKVKAESASPQKKLQHSNTDVHPKNRTWKRQTPNPSRIHTRHIENGGKRKDDYMEEDSVTLSSVKRAKGTSESTSVVTAAVAEQPRQSS